MIRWIAKYIALPCILVVAFPTTLMAQEDSEFEAEAEASVDAFSRFVWRGIAFNRDGVLQYTALGSAYGFTALAWANMPVTDLGGTRRAGELDEIDLVLDYTRSIASLRDIVGYSVGMVHYRFMRGYADPITELYGGLKFDVLLSPSVTWNQLFGGVTGAYAAVGIEHSFEDIVGWRDHLHMDVVLSASAGFGTPGFNDAFFGVSETRPVDFTMGAEVPFRLKYGFRVVPSAHGSVILSKDIRNAYPYSQHSPQAWFGVKLAKTFSFGGASTKAGE